MILILAFVVSLIPSVVVYLWLKGRMIDDQGYRDQCKKALIAGILSVFPVILASAVLSFLGKASGISLAAPLVSDAYHCFVVLALAEEASKYLMFRRVLERSQRNYSRLEMIALMTIVGIGFGLAEDIPYAISTNAGQMLVRGVTMGHGSYGFLMGLLVSRGEATQSRTWTALGFLVPWLMHGLYDFSLSDSMGAYDFSALIALALAAADLVIVIVMIFFMRKRRGDVAYTRPLR